METLPSSSDSGVPLGPKRPGAASGAALAFAGVRSLDAQGTGRRFQECAYPAGLADALKVVRALDLAGAGKEGCAAALGLLGLEVEPERRTPPPPKPPDSGVREGGTTPSTGPSAPPRPPDTRKPPSSPSTRPGAEGPWEVDLPEGIEVLEPVGFVRAGVPGLDWDRVAPLPTSPAQPEAEVLPVQVEPLLPPPRDRAILVSLASTWRPGRELDLASVLRALARRESISRFPRRPIRALARQLHLLVDVGNGMLPFATDGASFEAALRSVTGDEGVEVWFSEGCPMGRTAHRPGGNGPEPYEVPAPGTPILVLSDLGAAPTAESGAQEAEVWAAWALDCRRRGCPVVVLNPYEPGRWSSRLRREMVILEWDLTLTASEALRSVLKHKPSLRSRHGH